MAQVVAPFIGIMRDQGIRVEIGTPHCEEWMATHRRSDYCQGCESRAGCDKVARIAFLLAERSMAAAGKEAAPRHLAGHRVIDEETWSRALAIIGQGPYRVGTPDDSWAGTTGVFEAHSGG